MTKYTLTFPYGEERAFRETLSRLDDDEYVVVQDVTPVDDKDPRYCDRSAIIEMEPEAASTFRFRLGNSVKIRRERTEEELAEEKATLDQHIVKIRVQVPMGDPGTTP